MLDMIKRLFHKTRPEDSEIPGVIEAQADLAIEKAREVTKSLRRQREEEFFNDLFKPGNGRRPQ